jgi:membrane protein YqaA with SNARE-associated domain
VAVGLFSVGSIAAVVGMLASLGGAKGVIALVVVSSATALGAFAYLMARWVIDTIQPQENDSVETRLLRLKTLQERELISEREHAEQRRAILENF